MKYLLVLSLFLFFGNQTKAQSDSSQFAIIYFTDTDLQNGVIILTWNDGKVENLVQTLQIEKPLKVYRSSPSRMEIQLLQFMDSKGYDFISWNSYSYGTSTSKWIFRKRK